MFNFGIKNKNRIYREKLSLLIVILLLFCCISSAAADDSELPVITVDHTTSYMCGDIFEITFPDQISTGNMFTNASYVQASAAVDEKLLQVRVHMQNMTSSVFHGISSNSFELTGYVRDRSVTYLPEVIINTDYFGAGNYYAWDQLPPLRIADILLIFRVNPILINWELKFDPHFTGEPDHQLGQVTYTPHEAEPCAGIFQFSAVRNLENGTLTRFTRK